MIIRLEDSLMNSEMKAVLTNYSRHWDMWGASVVVFTVNEDTLLLARFLMKNLLRSIFRVEDAIPSRYFAINLNSESKEEAIMRINDANLVYIEDRKNELCNLVNKDLELLTAIKGVHSRGMIMLAGDAVKIVSFFETEEIKKVVDIKLGDFDDR